MPFQYSSTGGYSQDSVARTTWTIVIALLPATAASVWFFGPYALYLALDSDRVIRGATVSSRAIVSAVERILGALEEERRDAGDTITFAGLDDGVGQGYRGQISVNVSIERGRGEEITIDYHSETGAIGDRAMDRLSEQVIARQSLAVDAVSSRDSVPPG